MLLIGTRTVASIIREKYSLRRRIKYNQRRGKFYEFKMFKLRSSNFIEKFDLNFPKQILFLLSFFNPSSANNMYRNGFSHWRQIAISSPLISYSKISFQLQQFKSGAIQLSNQDGTKENGDGEKVISRTFIFSI